MKTTTPLAQVMRRPGVPEVDNREPRNYNEQQVARLKQIAIKMGLGKDEEIMAGKYSPHELEQMINTARTNK
jgi:signal transduction protein with GAF and PtsI domain